MKWRAEVRVRVGALTLEVALEGDNHPITVVGPNGSGKTTLLRALAGVVNPDAGRIQIGERVVFSSDDRVALPPEARRIGYVPQGYRLFPHLRVEDNVAFGLTYAQPGRSRAQRRQAAREMLERLDAAGLADRMPLRLSGGEQQRVALARALVVEPDLVLLDEPLSALDAASRRTMRATLVEHLRSHAGPAVVVTHDLRDVLAFGGTVYVLEDGRIVQHGAPEALRAEPATPFVAELFGV